MKLEEGMYVRTKDGDMFILDKIEDNHLIPRYVHRPYIITEEDVLKTSHTIIDLIEVGDYVNGSLIIEIRDYTYDNIKRIVTERSAMYSVAIREDELLDNLNSIVTKEQFESMSYKVGEE